MITGDPRVFANRTYLNLRYPRPIYNMPTAAHARAAFLSNVSYVRLNEGFDEANNYAMREGFLLDEVSKEQVWTSRSLTMQQTSTIVTIPQLLTSQSQVKPPTMSRSITSFLHQALGFCPIWPVGQGKPGRKVTALVPWDPCMLVQATTPAVQSLMSYCTMLHCQHLIYRNKYSLLHTLLICIVNYYFYYIKQNIYKTKYI